MNPIQTAFFISTDYPFPPETLTVSSPAGGSTTANLVILSGSRPNLVTGAPLAVDDTVLCTDTTGGCLLNILSNDGAEADPTTVTLERKPVNGTVAVNQNGTVAVNPDGTVTYTPDSAGTDLLGIIDSFVYTVDSSTPDGTPGLSSNLATVIINEYGSQPLPPAGPDPADEILNVTRFECKSPKNHWRVEGTSSLKAPHNLTIYKGDKITSPENVIVAFVPVDNLGDWRMPKNAGDCLSPISIESSTGAKAENVMVNIKIK